VTSLSLGLAPSATCRGCGTELAASLLVCPGCQRLVHAESLKRLAEEADAALASGDVRAAREAWRSALNRVPKDSRQSGQIAARIADLTRRLEESPPPPPAAAREGAPVAKKAGPLVAIGLVLWKLKFLVLSLLGKGKLLLVGLTKAPTLLTMVLSLGVYWTAWGWRFALGLVVSMYVHEIGHVAALQRYGIKSTVPMFVPGLGAFVRLDQYPANPAEDARVGLAGPIWGLAAAAIAYLVFLASGAPYWAAIARSGAWLNLFNLVPIWQLDGGRGLSALSSGQRLALAGVSAIAGLATAEGLVLLIAGVAAFRAWGGGSPARADRGVLLQFVVLVIALSALCALHVPGIAAR
jgi:Zn-dependent protease